MSSTKQAESSTSSSGPNIQLIRAALANYDKITGIDLSTDPFSAAIEQANSPEAILQLFQERAGAFKEFPNGNQRLTGILDPAVRVLHAFSGVLSEGGVMIAPETVILTGIAILLAATRGERPRYDVLIELFERLGVYLKRLEKYTTIPHTSLMTELVVKTMVELLSVLALVTKKFKEERFRKVTKKLLGEKEIGYTLQRLDRLTQDKVRMAVAPTLGVDRVIHGLVDDLKALMEDSRASVNLIRRDLDILHHILDDTKTKKLRGDVQRWLSPPNPSTNHNTFWSARHRGTAAWLFENKSFIEWKETGSLLWIHGKPGSGKSTLISAIIEDIRDMRAAGLASMAYYYFDFYDVKKQDRNGLLSSIIFQLSAQSNACYEILSRLYIDNTGGTETPTHSALLKCLKDMLRLPGQNQIFIIIDALDECPDFPERPSAREEVLGLMEELVDLKISSLHLCVASRPEMDIRMVLEPLEHFQISLHDESGQKEDIIAYIKAVVDSDRRMRRWKKEDQNLVVNQLSQNADGSFRWVVCQVNVLCYSFPRNIRSVLADLPRGLDKTYEKALLGINKEKREYALRLYQCLMVSIRPLLVEEFAEILAIGFDEAVSPMFNAAWRPGSAEEAVMSACSSLIAIVDSGGLQVVQFSHFSIKDYLTSERVSMAEERLSYHHILPEPAHTILACACLSVLLHLDDKIDRDTIRHFPLAPYAAQHWVDHAQFKNVSSHIEEVMKCLFDPAKPHFAAWVWLYDIDRYWTDRMPTIHPTQPEAMPLYYASLCGFYGLVEHLLVTHSQDVNAKGGHYVTSLLAALDKGHVKVAKLLLQHGADANARDGQHRTPLHIAAKYGDTEVIQSLIDHGADTNAKDFDQSIDSKDSLGSTPLHMAAENGHYDIASLLINKGADLDVQEKKLRTPIHLAADRGMLKVAEILLECGAEVDARDEMDQTPLHFAAQQGHLEVVRLLLEHHADVLALNREGNTFLDVAWASGHEEIVDVNARYEGGQTALHIAAQHGDTKLISWLIHHKLDPIHSNVEDEDQETPLFPASRNGKLDATHLLLVEGAKVNHRDWQKMTPLHGASENGHDAVAQLLLKYNAEVNAKHKNAWTPLHLASRAGQRNVAEVLLDKNAVVNAMNDSNWTPLHMASQEGHLDVVDLLLNNGADVNIQNEDGETALHLAAFYGHLEVAQVLLDHDPNSNTQIKDKNEMPRTLKLKSKGGKTPRELALGRGYDKLAQILELAALSGVGEPVWEHQFDQQLGEQQVIERVMVPSE